MRRITPQHKRILEWLGDEHWHCSTELEFMRDARKRFSELKDKGYNIEGETCTLGHKHKGNVYMRKWTKVKPTFRIEYDAKRGVAVQIPLL